MWVVEQGSQIGHNRPIRRQQKTDCVEKLPDVKYAYRIFSRGHQDDGEATERTGSSVLRLQ
ncbi:MAG: hypothetical protein WCE67_08095, partial [Azonexus sp.]